ncbi:putative Proteasome subunit beta type-1 [Monocercomonoides exilis]|uniref:putative Proteasome subunit beta type-1 n=1 Tax=Monocercomonoides exilis TaxID=2049356 RepID=UPI0035595D16|nr:putative Proteasome subunit beta type-1 [Monocercomonoides exilis]|eukprot:MONOS_4149.1-p1 / transcript=MONOS_4149.1 / gene=MONOS_4149 / organism=Monocercomonoides_exilis_PA203 / gene_product=Proteasome subunit beta type-1 / transcript_product=Proteasome subunit beta type-1 / location=Mono_scaffold00106:75674-76647(+) / protein_length=242 / sequence_SO=supercontig / SO=protein_coding / is_pseudo=false
MFAESEFCPEDAPKELKRKEFEPYMDNQGTCLGFSGKDYTVIAADTRCSDGYLIMSRHCQKIVKLTDKIVLATAGMRAEYATLHKSMLYDIEMYKYKNHKDISLPECAQLLQNTLYSHRFFPIYAFCILGGLDEAGKPALYAYDAIGSYQKTKVSAVGSGGQLVEPVLDSLILRHHRQKVPSEGDPTGDKDWNPSEEKAIEYAHQALISAAERDIHTGDFAEIYVINKTGVKRIIKELKFD